MTMRNVVRRGPLGTAKSPKYECRIRRLAGAVAMHARGVFHIPAEGRGFCQCLQRASRIDGGRRVVAHRVSCWIQGACGAWLAFSLCVLAGCAASAHEEAVSALRTALRGLSTEP